MRKILTLAIAALFLNLMVSSLIFAQGEAVTVMALADGTPVNMTAAQLNALQAQPGITVSASPTVMATEIAVPLPEALGGGFLIGEPAALAAGMNAVGITTGATAASVAGATAVAGVITVGTDAGAAVTAGITTGTVTTGLAVAAGVAAIAVAAGSGGGGGTTTTTTHH